jgi:hypothetical protein
VLLSFDFYAAEKTLMSGKLFYFETFSKMWVPVVISIDKANVIGLLFRFRNFYDDARFLCEIEFWDPQMLLFSLLSVEPSFTIRFQSQKALF